MGSEFDNVVVLGRTQVQQPPKHFYGGIAPST